MHKSNERTMIRPVCVLMAISLLTACATTGTTPEAQVGKRAQERWDLLLADDLDSAYAYFTPGFRSSVPLKTWQRKLLTQQIRYESASVSGSECENGVCEVTVNVAYSVHGALPGVPRMESRTAVKEDWILSGKQWFYLPEN